MWSNVAALTLALVLLVGLGIMVVLIFINALWFLQNDGKADRGREDPLRSNKGDTP